MHLFYDCLGAKMKSVILKQACGGFFQKKWKPVINISWFKNEKVKVCFFMLESPYPYFCCNLRHNVMPYVYSEMQNKLSKTRESPLESMGQIISSRCPILSHDFLQKLWKDSFCMTDTTNNSEHII